MKSSGVSMLVAGILAASLALLAGNRIAAITVDYPAPGAVFPPDISAPSFRWRDADAKARVWRIEISFDDGGSPLTLISSGDRFRPADPDPACAGSALPDLTPDQAAEHTWRPDARTWEEIKRRSAQRTAIVTITGFPDRREREPVSRGSVSISASRDPVGAPIFYRDVPLMVSPAEKGVIQPLPPSAIPLIRWRLRNVADLQSRTVMENVYTCANCHSFSRDGKTLGLDVDGPANDKGLYALAPVARDMAIRNQDVIRWSSLQDGLDAKSAEPAVKRFGFMSQVSPDGEYVITSIGDPSTRRSHDSGGFAPGLADRLFNAGYKDYRFGQVFYPTRGILAWYSKKERKLRPLPGADDPRFVHTSAFWSPDGRYLIYSRAEARDPYPPGAKAPEYANDPNETQVQYDLYRIPFNEGRGGVSEPVEGASGNGKSNSFPKVSPDGRWIVWVQCKNGLLMRPDSELWIVPFTGGRPRRLRSNTRLMNSWHSFSPNGRWLVFSSKADSPYTQMYLTHLDENGNDTPPILIENATAGNRAVNIPEFVNIKPDGLEKIEPQAMAFYRVYNTALELMTKNRMGDAIAEWRKALEMEPDDAKAHYNLAYALGENGDLNGAVAEYRKACAMGPDNAVWYAHFALALAQTGKPEEAVEDYRKSLSLDPKNPAVESDLGVALFETGRAEEGLGHLRRAVALAPESPDAAEKLGTALAKTGQREEANEQLRKAVELSPDSAEYAFNLGYVLASGGDFAGAIPYLEKAVKLSGGQQAQCLEALAAAYGRSGRPDDAARTVRQAIDLAVREKDPQLEKRLRAALARLEAATQAEPR